MYSRISFKLLIRYCAARLREVFAAVFCDGRSQLQQRSKQKVTHDNDL